MATPWLCRRPVSQCPEWHKKVKPMTMACVSDRKLDEAPVAYTAEVDMKDESLEAVGPTDGA